MASLKKTQDKYHNGHAPNLEVIGQNIFILTPEIRAQLQKEIQEVFEVYEEDGPLMGGPDKTIHLYPMNTKYFNELRAQVAAIPENIHPLWDVINVQNAMQIIFLTETGTLPTEQDYQALFDFLSAPTRTNG